MLQAVLISAVAGVVGTGLGGVIALFFSGSSDKTMSYVLSLASGVMLSIVCFELIPGALVVSNFYLVIAGTAAGVIVTMSLNLFIDKITASEDTHVHPEELWHETGILESTKSRSMLVSGLVMFAAMSLHNLPEGMAIGSGAAHDSNMGLVLAILIALHDIPEGMAVGVPLIAGNMNKWKAVLLTVLSGVSTVLGGWLGAVLGGISDGFLAIALSLAAGAMLYVSFCEMLPQVILLNRERRPAYYTIIGFVLGLFIVNFFS